MFREGFTYQTNLSKEEIIKRAVAYLKAAGFKTKVEGYTIKAVDGRDFSTALCLIFFLLGIVPFLIYWFTRKKNRIIIDVSKPNQFTISYEGMKALQIAEGLINKLKE